MKWTSAIPLALLSALSTASPLPQEEPDSYDTPSDLTIYNLKIDAPSVPDLHNKLLSKSTDQVGLFPNAPALEFYLTTRPQEATTLATYPIGIVHEALVLTGTNSLYDLKTTQPDLVEVTPGTTFSVNEFTLDEPSGQVSWRGAKDSAWVAFPSSADPEGFEIKWKNPDAITIQNFFPVRIVYQKATHN
ncbi:hypothetical protein HYQ44_012175 [Verticillium longisporum]|nr:hypothetical protein HYQ44_012175 [Verticillium longisporum]